MSERAQAWPQGADGDVFRRLQSQSFDFSKEYEIDFNVDFDEWPPGADAIAALQTAFPGARAVENENVQSGYIVFSVRARLTYDLVTRVQARATALVERWGGACESWGVLH